jgi:hypothetical protein
VIAEDRKDLISKEIRSFRESHKVCISWLFFNCAPISLALIILILSVL